MTTAETRPSRQRRVVSWTLVLSALGGGALAEAVSACGGTQGGGVITHTASPMPYSRVPNPNSSIAIALCAPNSDAASAADFGASEHGYNLDNVAWPGHDIAYQLSGSESGDAIYVEVVNSKGDPQGEGFVKLTGNVQDQISATPMGQTVEYHANNDPNNPMQWKVQRGNPVSLIPVCPTDPAYYG
jgi:hypothetical protein